MPSINSFATKRGVVYFTDDTILFEESIAGYVHSLYQEYWQSDVWWRKAIFIGYVLTLLVAVSGIISTIQRGRILLLSGALVLLVVLWLVDYVRGFRSLDRIPLDAVEDVSATRGKKGLTRPRLVVTYTDGGSAHKRRVNLLSLYTVNGETAFERALEAFEEREVRIE